MARYFSTQRPVGLGTYPRLAGNKVLEIVNFDDREFREEIGRPAWGYLDYEREIPEDAARAYELVQG